MLLIKIRQAKENDANAIFKIHRSAILNIKDYLYSKEIKKAWAPKNKSQTLQIIRGEQYYTIVAEVENKIVGFGSVTDNKVELLFVAPEYQNLGVASKMLKHLEDKTSHPIELKAPKNSVEFYHKHGYKIKSKFNQIVNNQIFDRFLASKD